VENDELIFANEVESESTSTERAWKILIVDDDEDIHTVTKLALDGVVVNNRGLTFVSAYSAAEAKELLAKHTDIALVFLDIVMEHNLAGLDVVDFIRKKLHNDRVRVIIRTGEPGSAPEQMIIDNYDINDYKEKTELNAKRLYTTVRSSLLQYQQLETLYAYQQDLQKTIDDKVKEICIQEDALIESNKQSQMGDFLNMISHQWRQPLSRIAAVVSQIKIGRSLDNISDTEMDEMLDSAEEHIQNLSKIIKDFQNLYHVESSKSYVSISSVVENTLNLLRDSLDEAGIKVTVDKKGLSSVAMVGSEMNQVFINLIKNAFDAIKREKQSSGVIEIRLQEQEGDLLVEIEDNAGLSNAELLSDKIFDPYVSSEQERQGKGLGLYICKMIAEKHCYGKISLHQGKNGACFRVQIPIQKDRR
jgi:signal transduction histidine kinase